MRKIINLICSLIFVIGLIICYTYFEQIKDYFYMFVTKHNEVKLKEPNEYKRKYLYERFSNEEDYIPYSIGDIENIFYNILNNGWDEFIFYCPTEYKECINDVEKVSSDTNLMSKIAGYVNPYNSHQTINTTISSYGEIYVNVSKKYSKLDIENINNKIIQIYYEQNMRDKTKEEKMKLFHDYLIKNTIYDETFASTGQSVYDATKATGALLEGYAVCGGYADALAIFLDYINVPNIIITNDNHAWNLVYVDDYYLHIDPTWNDTEIPRFEYEFYMIDTNKLYEIDTTEHTFDKDFFIEAK